MNLNEIRNAVLSGKTVFWKSMAYRVVQDNELWFIEYYKGDRIALTWTDGVTLNGEEKDFFIDTGELLYVR